MPFETPSGAVDGVNATFTTVGVPVGDSYPLVDRLPQIQGVDFTRAGNVYTFLSGSIPQTGSLVTIWSSGSVAASSLLSTPGIWDTAGNVISDAAVELGLGVVSDAFGSSDPNIIQLRTLLKSAGRELVRERAWTHLQKQYVFSTVGGQTVYGLPSDFRSMIETTGWNRSTRLPLSGPATAQDWEFLAGWSASVTVRTIFRLWNGQLSLYAGNSVPDGQTIALEYLSTSWVKPAGLSFPSTDAPTANTDTLCFDSLLMVRALKLAWLKAKGFDTTSAQADYDRALAMVSTGDGQPKTLDLAGATTDPLLGIYNIPVTGIGS